MQGEIQIADGVMVSVLMMSYNHEAFIEQAIRSVLDQKCDFPFEIVLGDDASTDGTLEKARSMQRQRPDILRILPAERNLGVTHNFLRTLEACRGRYIALFDGDDYWVDERKLQFQVDQLERDGTLALSACRTRNRQFWGPMKERYTLVDLLRRYLFHTSALVFRKAHMAGYPVIPRFISWDTLLIAHLATHGDCGLIDLEMSYYRRHSGGIWTGADMDRQVADAQAATNALSIYFNGRYDRELFDRELWIYEMMMVPDLSRPVLVQWIDRWQLLRPLFFRTTRFHPVRSFKQSVRILLFPASASLSKIRRKLGLRTFLARLRIGFGEAK